MLADQQRLTVIGAVQTLDAVEKSYYVLWPIVTDGKRESKESVL